MVLFLQKMEDMAIMLEVLFSDFRSVIIGEGITISIDKIKEIVENKNKEYQNVESQIYSITVECLNKITGGKYINNQDVIYGAAEQLLKGFKDENRDDINAIKDGIRGLINPVNNDICERFITVLCEEISADKYVELYRNIMLLQEIQKNRKTRGIEDKIDKIDQEVRQGFDRLSRNLYDKGGESPYNISIQKRIKSIRQEYFDKWNKNMFLNDFNKRDENAGVNVKLSEVYLDKHLPHYIWENNKNPRNDLKDLLSEYINEEKENKMLLILGQPGIGKSTLITWITANYIEREEDILVY